MKAAVYYETGAPDVFRYEDVPEPVCAPGGVVIDVEAVSIEGGDVLNRKGGALVGSPHVVGYQCAGTISEVGSNVTDRNVGQRVVAVAPFGSHASRAAYDAQATWVIPDGLDLQQAATIPIPFGTADVCLFEFGRLRDGESVLIQGGAGGVGIAAIQLAKRAGATVLATASSDDKLSRLQHELGLDHGINYKTSNFVDEARKLTGGQGVDLVVDSVGSTLLASIDALAYKGRLVTVGDMDQGKQPVDTSLLSARNLTVTGVFFGAELLLGNGRELVRQLIDDVAAGKLKTVVDRTFPLSEAAAAHAYIESRRAFGRVLLIP